MLLFFSRKLSDPKISAETNISAETTLFLQKPTPFCRKAGLSVGYIFLFRPSLLRLISNELDAQQYLTGSSLRMMLTGGKVPSVALQPTPNVQ